MDKSKEEQCMSIYIHTYRLHQNIAHWLIKSSKIIFNLPMSSNKNYYYAVLLLCNFAASCYKVASLSSSDDDDSMYVKHEKWMAQHGFNYKNEEE